MKQEIADRLIADIHKIPVFERHIIKSPYHIGTFVFQPISVWNRDIDVIVDVRRNVFKKALDEFVKQHEDVLRFAYFINAEGCAPYLHFSTKKQYDS